MDVPTALRQLAALLRAAADDMRSTGDAHETGLGMAEAADRARRIAAEMDAAARRYGEVRDRVRR